jgi:hypothetical protein
MSWRGRKRTLGERYPGGKLKRSRKPKPDPPQPHRRGYGSNPLAETQHGRYFLDGAINGSQHTAGQFYGRSRLCYRAAIGAPDGLRSHALTRTSVHDSHLDGSDENDVKIIAEFEAARSALGRLVVDVEWVVVQDAMLADLTAYRAGLDVLRKLYRV